MRVIAFIEQAHVIRKIREHLGLWGIRRRPIPKVNAPPVPNVAKEVECYFPTVDDDMVDPIYPVVYLPSGVVGAAFASSCL
jgi:hypothetical protein